MGASRYVHLDFDEIKAETDKAFLVLFADGTEEWIPRSQVADPDDYEAGSGEGTISLTEWICKQKGIELP